MNCTSTISMTNILAAISYYSRQGYNLIDVPQCVDFEVSQFTKPEGTPELFHKGMKVYVASAEQSFIQLNLEGKLPSGKFMAVTPCYRHEGCLDDTHFSMFLKLELISVGDDTLDDMVDHSLGFFGKYLPCDMIITEDDVHSQDYLGPSIDIVAGDASYTELGSYGVRRMLDGCIYTYGTGIAEPRFSTVVDWCYNDT